jgi:DNA polymerase-3 subunit epsilon
MSSVSKQTGLLVCADPHTQSGKATKARALGIRVISEAVFWDALSVAGVRV